MYKGKTINCPQCMSQVDMFSLWSYSPWDGDREWQDREYNCPYCEEQWRWVVIGKKVCKE